MTSGVGRAAVEERPGDRSGSARAVLRTIGWAAGYALAIWLGDLTVADDSGYALAWPASGVALVWIATGGSRTARIADLVLLGVVGAGTLYLLDATTWEALNALVGAPLGLAVFVAAARHRAPGLWGTGGTQPVETLRQYGALVGVALLAGAAEAGVAIVILGPEPGPAFEHAGELLLTHTVALVTLGVTGLIVGGWIAGLPRGRFFGRVVAGVRRDSTRTDLLIATIATGLAGLIVAAGFVWVDGAPVSFVLVMAVVGVGIRFSAATTGLYAVAIGVAACWFTVAGNGPMATILEPHQRALAFGLFLLALVVTGLTIALSRRERDATIGQLRESEHTLEARADDLSLVLANLEEGVAVVERSGRFIHANEAIRRLLAMPSFNQAQVEAVESYHLVHPDGRPLQESEIPHVRAFAGEEDVHDILHLARPDVPGERVFEVAARLLPQIRSTDEPRAVTTIRDVTAEHQQRDALASFAQTVAHDLRSPLTSVELWAQELLDTYHDGPVDAETGTMMLRHVVSAAGRMQSFISDLLAYALARDQAPSPVELALTDVVDSVLETIAVVEGDQPDVRYAGLPTVWCDPVLVPQLFDNLIGNARKYVAHGVEPEVRIEAEPLPGDWAQVRVCDNGIGIEPEDRVRVFGTFERAHATEYEGTGLGLAICRHIVERHGGTIAVVSPPSGSGTCIEFTLPRTEGAFERATTRPRLTQLARFDSTVRS